MTSPSQSQSAGSTQESGFAPSPPPPLPPRRSNNAHSARPDSSLTAMSSHDPRSSSQQSLVPDPNETAGRRRLLLVYIHGFQGDETSFRSFPAHVHNLATITLAESHVVHTKIYPKYRSRYAIEVARDDFSKWLVPHEDQWTDVVLLSHSMGGLIAAEVVLLFRHRIVGAINFDVPFVGMHPGIIKAGLGSIFKPWPTPIENLEEEAANPSGKRPSRMNTLFNPKPSDPNFNPSFSNDVHLPVRKGWENTLHWMNKHSNGIVQAGKSLVRSHFEFGSAMADYPSLKARYARLRALEEDDETKRKSANPDVRSPPRIRFLNYYTASTGRPKKPKEAKETKSPSPSRPPSRGLEHYASNTNAHTSGSTLTLNTNAEKSTVSPRISVDLHRENEVVPVTPQAPPSATSPTPGVSFDIPQPETNAVPDLPEIPPIPRDPPFVDLAEFPDKAQRRAAEREHDQALKEYHQAVKARNKVINERSKIQEKWEKQKQKETKEQPVAANEDKADSGHEASGHETDTLEDDFGAMQLGVIDQNRGRQGNSPYGNYDFSRSVIMNSATPDDSSSVRPSSDYTDSMYSLATTDTNASAPEPGVPPKKKRLKKFCMLPPKDASGNKDPTWVRVFMGPMDEVAAHTTLFFVSDTYERLVGDTGARIESWVREADDLRVATEMDGLF